MLVAGSFCAALGCGLMAGVFLAFSSFVMSALARLPAAQGIAAMQSINIRAINPIFMAVFCGTAAACSVLCVLALVAAPPGAAYLLSGGLSYVVGSFLVTLAFNVPRNHRLARVDPEDAEAARLWNNYLRSWTTWNHVRMIASLIATGILTFWLYHWRA